MFGKNFFVCVGIVCLVIDRVYQDIEIERLKDRCTFTNDRFNHKCDYFLKQIRKLRGQEIASDSESDHE